MIPLPFDKTFPTMDIDNPSQGFRDNWTAIEVAVDGKLNVNGTNSMAGPLVLASDPTLALHAATKQYVDSIATGLDVKESVRVTTTANISLSGTQTIDAVALIVGDRVLVKDQIDSKENGLYDVSASGWLRSADADNSPAGEMTSGMFTFIEEGSASGTGWVLTTADPIIIGISNLIFSQFSDASVTISSVFGRVGAVAAVSGDYTASEIINVPTGTIASTNVQSALNELDSEKATSAQGALADSSVQPLDNITTLTNNAGYVTTSGLVNIVEDLTPQLGGILDAQTNKIINLGTPTLGSDAVTKAYVDGGSGSLVSSVFTRTGAVVAAIGDYTASEITNVPAGNIIATTVQAALAELDSEKATSAQGALADSALQTGDNISLLNNNSGFVTSSGLNNIVEDLTPQLGGELDAQTNKIINLGTPTLTTDATTKAYVDGILANPVGFIEDFHGFMETPVNKSYVLMLSASYNFNISQITLQLISGTLTAQLLINNILAGPAHNVTSVALVNSTIINILAGQKVELVITASATPVDFAFSITRIRT